MTTEMVNDTGSNASNLFYHVARILALGIPVPLRQVFLEAAGGCVRRNTTVVEIHIVGRNGAPLTEWMLEVAVLIYPPATHLFGESMRSRLYFATAPTHTQPVTLCLADKNWTEAPSAMSSFPNPSFSHGDSIRINPIQRSGPNTNCPRGMCGPVRSYRVPTHHPLQLGFEGILYGDDNLIEVSRIWLRK